MLNYQKLDFKAEGLFSTGGPFQEKFHRDRFFASLALFGSLQDINGDSSTKSDSRKFHDYHTLLAFCGENEKMTEKASKIKMDDLIKNFDKLVLEKTSKSKQLVDFVNLLLNEEDFEKKYGFKLLDHIKECEEFVIFLHDKVNHIRSCNNGTGKLSSVYKSLRLN